jgi:N-acetylmuramoyl-L-alanine amidase
VEPTEPAAAATPAATPARTAASQITPAVTHPGGLLEYRGEDAVYRLKPGEALYSAVVIRFTGQLHAVDVNATAAEVAKHSGIADVTGIPVGFPIRIPKRLLLPEFLPPGDPGRLAWEKEREEIQAIKRAIRAANLDGIHVILDAGHGGNDTGAVSGDIWEANYVYDVMARVKRVLDSETRATVWATVRDGGPGAAPPDADVLGQHRGQTLLTDPPYDLSDSPTGVHLRWVLANDILERLRRRKVDPERVAFISIHADSLHPSIRGLMVYVPSRSLRSARAPAIGSLHECKELESFKPPRFPAAFASRAEALSTQLGEAIVASAQRYSVPVHPYSPVRSSVVRGGGTWVPAVLKYSRVPTAVLVEICNLNNEADRASLQTKAFREKLAHSIAAGLAEAFAR